MTFLILSLAAYRVWRIAAYDIADVMQALRDSRKWSEFVAKGIRCPWCSGFWVAGVIAVLAAAFGAIGWLAVIPVWLASSVIVGLIGDHT